jgi:HSP20 family protein
MLVRRAWPQRPGYDGAFSDFDQVRRELLRLFDSVAGDPAAESGTGVFPPLNVTQDEDNVYIRAEIPGVDAQQLTISALRNRVSLGGKREIALEPGKGSYHRRERPEGSFSRTLSLPVEIDAERVDARYVNGVLTLSLPKAAAAKPRQISVRT